MVSKELIENEAFTNCIYEAAPYRVRIINDYNPAMKELKKEFIRLMIEADYKDIKQILAKKKLDKKDAGAKMEYNIWRKARNFEFGAITKCIDPNAERGPSLGLVYKVAPLLKYIGKQDIIDNVLTDKSIGVTIPSLESGNEVFADEDTRTQLKYLFDQAVELRTKIKSATDEIKVTQYENLPVELQYSKDNKNGLKVSQFSALVRNKAMAVIKDEDKYTKYLNTQIENGKASMVREEIVVEKNKNL